MLQSGQRTNLSITYEIREESLLTAKREDIKYGKRTEALKEDLSKSGKERRENKPKIFLQVERYKMSQTILTEHMVETFLEKLHGEQKSKCVIAEYDRNIRSLMEIAKGNILTREVLEEWNQKQLHQGLAKGTITNRKVKINYFLREIGCQDLCFVRSGRRNLKGMQFGDLIVLEETMKKSADRSIRWRCKCGVCGKEKEIPTNQLMKGVQVSCGCRKKSQLQKTNGYIEGTCLKMVFSDKVSKNNTSGYKGVFQKRGKWAANIQYKKKTYYLGYYDRLEDAVAARKDAERWVREDAKKLLEKYKGDKQKKFIIKDEVDERS